MRCGVFFLLLLCLAACSTPPAPVDQRQQPPSRKISTHEVGKGETLFSIAWAYGLDYRGLARANGIDSSYIIHPGQILQLREEGTSTVGERPVVSHINRPPVTHNNNPVSPSAPRPMAKSMGEGEVSWQWPANGKVLRSFSAAGNANKGIDIAGNLGDPVTASSAGKVVYAGSGLLGYGLLIIIKHNDRYLSAYAHNRELLVKEGDSVRAGDKIAEIGSSGTRSVKLHFEIRRDGKPVDPERYLPAR